MQAEWLASTAYALGEAYPAKELHESWECVLLHQFHDIIPGSSIHEVYEDSRVNYRMAEERADRARNRMLAVLTERKEHRYGVFSVNSFGGEELVRVGTDGCGSFRDENGQPLKAQRTENGYDVQMDITPFAVKHITFVPGGETEPGESVFLSWIMGSRRLFIPFSGTRKGSSSACMIRRQPVLS